MNCTNCGGPMVLDAEKQSYHCSYCTSTYFIEETEDGVRPSQEPAGLRCPVCQEDMVQAFAGRNTVSYCPKCRGMLIPQIAFLGTVKYLRGKSRLPSQPPQPFKPDELRRHLSCPKCGRPMDTHPYGGPGNIVIDNCTACLVNWLDYKELSRVVRAQDRSSWEVSPEVEKKLFKQHIEQDRKASFWKRRDRDD